MLGAPGIACISTLELRSVIGIVIPNRVNMKVGMMIQVDNREQSNMIFPPLDCWIRHIFTTNKEPKTLIEVGRSRGKAAQTVSDSTMPSSITMKGLQ
jgi:hypothetical protein